MPKIAYVTRDFRNNSLDLISKANTIIAEYEAQGLILTLRQLYYQFVSRDWLPNKQASYNQLGGVVNDGRLAGLIDWEAIEDRTRNLQKNSHWETPADIIDTCARSYQIDKWQGQKYQPEVWIEKEALAGVVERVCTGLDVPFFACRGYSSQSEMWRAANRLNWYRLQNRIPVIIHLGDHDPSGIDMTRDIRDRLITFMGEKSPDVERIALNMDQVEEYSPPPNPAKVTDSRFVDYQREYGDESWELDALEPRILMDLITAKVKSYRNEKIWRAQQSQENHEKELLSKVSEEWERIKDLIE